MSKSDKIISLSVVGMSEYIIQILQKMKHLTTLQVVKLVQLWIFSELLKVSHSMNLNTSPFDCTGHPALSINAGFSDGLPVGMMIVGRHFDETTVYQVARAYEEIRDK